MTREEARNVLANYRQPEPIRYDVNEVYEALDMALEALEQEPCEDAISRQSVKAYVYHRTSYPFKDYVDMLPSVTPQPKTGHWIDREVYDADRWKCSECGRTEQYQETFCPNCGAKMERNINNGQMDTYPSHLKYKAESEGV